MRPLMSLRCFITRNPRILNSISANHLIFPRGFKIDAHINHNRKEKMYSLAASWLYSYNSRAKFDNLNQNTEVEKLPCL